MTKRRERHQGSFNWRVLTRTTRRSAQNNLPARGHSASTPKSDSRPSIGKEIEKLLQQTLVATQSPCPAQVYANIAHGVARGNTRGPLVDQLFGQLAGSLGYARVQRP